MEAIRIENVKKSFKKTNALKGVSLSLEEGDLLALLGENGAGKTTLIKILCSLLLKDEGKVTIYGLDLDSCRDKIKTLINISPQETAVAPNLTVKENLELICALYDKDRDNVQKTLEKMGLREVAQSKAKTLSGGMQRRLSIALALITEPKLLFLDEPTLALDVSARRELWKIIKQLKGNTTIVLTTHYIEEAEALADKVVVLSKGEVVASGSTNDLLKLTGRQNLEDAFLKLIGEDYE